MKDGRARVFEVFSSKNGVNGDGMRSAAIRVLLLVIFGLGGVSSSAALQTTVQLETDKLVCT
jgi:hypothetical protein